MCYKRVLEKFKSVVFPDDSESDGVEYYVANGRGMSICSEDEVIQFDNNEREEECSLDLANVYKILKCSVCVKSMSILCEEIHYRR